MPLLIILFSLIGFIDAGYLTYEHYFGNADFCPWNNPWLACGRVLDSAYAIIGPVPVALLGNLHYLLLLAWFFLYLRTQKPWWLILFQIEALAGFLISLWLVYLQAFVLQAFCAYCLISAAASILIFLQVLLYFCRRAPTPATVREPKS